MDISIKGLDLTEFLLQAVRRCPGMYLFRPKLLYLNIFITGYTFAMYRNETEQKDRFLDLFSDWFIVKIKGHHGTMWYPEILEECGNSEEKALFRFWEYLEEFDTQTRKTF